MSTVFLAVDSGGVLGLFTSRAQTEEKLAKYRAIPQWAMVVFEWPARTLKDGDELEFLFPPGNQNFPITFGSSAEIAELARRLECVGLADTDDPVSYTHLTLPTIYSV